MKKIYQKPTAQTCSLFQQYQLLSGSDVTTVVQKTTTNLSEDDQIEFAGGGDVEARGRSLRRQWDDEDEE